MLFKKKTNNVHMFVFMNESIVLWFDISLHVCVSGCVYVCVCCVFNTSMYFE